MFHTYWACACRDFCWNMFSVGIASLIKTYLDHHPPRPPPMYGVNRIQVELTIATFMRWPAGAIACKSHGLTVL